MSTVMAVDSTQGKRVFLSIQNHAALTSDTVTAELTKIGVAFDQSPRTVAACPIHIFPGGSVLFDKTVPQNRIWLVSDASVEIQVGIVVSNVSP